MCFITQTSSPCDHPQCKAIQQLITSQLQNQQTQAFSLQQQQQQQNLVSSKDNMLQQLLNNVNSNSPSQYYQFLLQQQLFNQQQSSTQSLNQLLLQSGADDLNFLLEKRKFDPNSSDLVSQLLLQQSQQQKKVKVDPLQQLFQQANRQQTVQNSGLTQQLQQQNLQNAINSLLPKIQNQSQMFDLASLFSAGQNLPTLQQQQQQSSQQFQQNILQNILQKQISNSNCSTQIESPKENNNVAMVAELSQIKKSSFDSLISQEETQDSVNSANNAMQGKDADGVQKVTPSQFSKIQANVGTFGQQICAKKREDVEDQSKGQQYIKYEEVPQNIRECLEEKKEFQYQLILKDEFPKTLQRNKNFSITCELHNNQGKKIFNTNKIVLSICALTYDLPQRLINLSKNWKKMVLGKTTTNLFQGVAFFDQVQLNAVTTYYKNSCIQLIIFPQQQLLEISEQSSNQYHVDFLEIKPIIIDNIFVKTKINDFTNANSTEQQQQQQKITSVNSLQPQLQQYYQQQQQQQQSINNNDKNQESSQQNASLQSLATENNAIAQQQQLQKQENIGKPLENQANNLFNQLKLLSDSAQINTQFSSGTEQLLQQLNQNLQSQQQNLLLSAVVEENQKKSIQRQNIILKQIPTNEQFLNQSVN